MSDHLDLILLVCVFAALLAGYPVGLTLGGVSVLIACLGWMLGAFDMALFYALPSRLFGVITNPVLLSIPLFVVMGLVLERSKLASDMIEAAAYLFRNRRGGLQISVVIVGTLLAASTGIVGASVVALGLLALPTMLQQGIPAPRASGVVAASGTLGQLIPPSIVLIVLGDQISNAWQVMQTRAGNFAPDTVSVTDLFAGAILPGLVLVATFVCYLWWSSSHPQPKAAIERPQQTWGAFLPPLVLIVAVLGSIFSGVATPSEAASVGAVGSLILAAKRLNRTLLAEVFNQSAQLVSIIFLIIIGASIFSLVFRGLGGEETISSWLTNLPGGTYGALLVVMMVIFLLGFFLEFIEITFVVVPLVAPVLLAMPMADGSAMSPIWLAVLIAINLQTSFLTPPFGVSLFYLRSVAPNSITTTVLYRGVVPFILMQLVVLFLVMAFPVLATYLPTVLLTQ